MGFVDCRWTVNQKIPAVIQADGLECPVRWDRYTEGGF